MRKKLDAYQPSTINYLPRHRIQVTTSKFSLYLRASVVKTSIPSSRRIGRRRLTRRTTRLLPGAQRLREPNYLGIAAAAIRELLRLDARMQPHILALIQQEQDQKAMEQWEAALRKVYGVGPPDPNGPQPSKKRFLLPKEKVQLLKEEELLLKTKLVLARLKDALSRPRWIRHTLDRNRTSASLD